MYVFVIVMSQVSIQFEDLFQQFFFFFFFLTTFHQPFICPFIYSHYSKLIDEYFFLVIIHNEQLHFPKKKKEEKYHTDVIEN